MPELWKKLESILKGVELMFKFFFEIFILPSRIMVWCIKAVFWIPLLLLGFIFDDGLGPGR